MVDDLFLDATQQVTMGPKEENFTIKVWRNGQIAITRGSDRERTYKIAKDKLDTLLGMVARAKIEQLKPAYSPPAPDAPVLSLNLNAGGHLIPVVYGTFVEGAATEVAGELDGFFDLWECLNGLVIEYCDSGATQKPAWLPPLIVIAMVGILAAIWALLDVGLTSRILLSLVVILAGIAWFVVTVAEEE